MNRWPLIMAFALIAACSTRSGQAGEWMATPSLTMGAGYESNPLGVISGASNRVDSIFLRLASGVELTLFATPSVEWRGGFDYNRIEFSKGEVGAHDVFSVQLEWRWVGLSSEASVSFDGGSYRDSGQPDDDEIWFAMDPWWRWTLPDPAWSLLTGLRLQESRLQELDTEETLTTLRLGPSWQSSLSTTWWIEGSMTLSSASVQDSDYTGWGVTAGVDHWLTPKLLLYMQASLEQLDYSAGESETPVFIEVGNRYRMRPWLEWFMATVWNQPGSSSGEDQNASVQVGLRLARDLHLHNER